MKRDDWFAEIDFSKLLDMEPPVILFFKKNFEKIS